MRESEGGYLKAYLQYLYIGNTAQSRPRETLPSIHLFGRSRETSLDFTRLPERFYYRSTTTTTNNTTTDRVFIHLNSLHAAC